MTKQEKIKFLKSEFQRFIKYFNLLDYEYFYDEYESDNFRCAVSWYSYDHSDNPGAKTIEFKWSKNWIESKIDKYELSKVAFHEAMEILLLPLRELASCRNIIVTNREIELENHRIIRTLENTIFEKLKK
jgi:hypothetical protein